MATKADKLRRTASRSPTFTTPTVPSVQFPLSILQRSTTTLVSLTRLLLGLVLLHTVDTLIFLLNLVSPRKGRMGVTPRAFAPDSPPPFIRHPVIWLMCAAAKMLGQRNSPEWLWAWTHWRGIGYRGDWGQPRLEKDYARSPCAALNALANHDILPRNGRHITPAQMSAAIQYSYNLAPTIAIQLMAPFEPLWRDRGWFDLSDLSAQGLVQHDGSFTREDVSSPYAFETTAATQARPSQRLLDLYFPAEYDGELTWRDHARVQAHVRSTARRQNPQFVFNPLHHIFAAGNSALTHAVLGPRMDHVRAWLGGENGCEQLLPGWESDVKEGWGISIIQAQLGTARIELAAGALDGKPRFENVADGVAAQGGWNPMLGKVGEQAKRLEEEQKQRWKR
ncbi:hypothetical protein JCM6882_005259 [Rhodosporidiobolus microsporus]